MKRKLIISCIAVSAVLAMAISANAACDHHFTDDFSQSVAATCSEEGKRVEVCTRCEETRITAIDKLPHDFVVVAGEKETCTDDSTIIQKCSMCGKTEADTTKALGHDYKETKRVAATCSKEGSVTYKCDRCDGTETEVLPLLPHDFSKFISSSATCTTAGKSTYQCSMCPELVLESVKALGHDLIKDGGPTCTKSGIYTYTCSRCDYSKKDTRATKALGHDLPSEGSAQWKTLKKATCTEAGSKRARCERCKEYVTVEIPILDHNYGDTLYLTKAPTSTSSGKAKQECSSCGKSISKTVLRSEDLSKYQIPDVVASKDSGEISRSDKIELSCELAGVTIYYTTNGKTPTSKSYRREYKGPIELFDTAVVKAYAVLDDSDVKDAAVITRSYYVDENEPWVYFKDDASLGGYMPVKEGGKFRPEDKATRYEVIAALDKLFDSYANDYDVAFRDVDTEHAEMVSKFVGAKLLNGYEDGTFKGNNSIKRSELCKVLSIALGLEIDYLSEVTFKDMHRTHWAYPYVAALTKEGYLAGDTDGNFRPEDNISRAELAVVLNRIAGIDQSSTSTATDVKSTHWAYGYICSAIVKSK